MKTKVLFVVFFISAFTIHAQEHTISFTGKPVVTVFANYHAGLGSANGDSGFELDRSYLGYRFRLNEKLSGRVIFDVGPTKAEGAELERVAYVKNAMLTWSPGRFTLDFGLVKTEQFSLQESFWGYRYILKSFQDEYKFGPSADMGIIGKYRFFRWLSADLSLTNGEGYKKVNKDNHYRYGAGITLRPDSCLLFRIYGDIYTGSTDSTRNQSALSFFAGYTHPRFRIGAEYNKLFHENFSPQTDKAGCSFYTSVNVGRKFSVFGRYDYLYSDDEGYSSTEGQRVLAGLQYRPFSYLKLAPDFTVWNPRRGRAEPFLFFHVEFNL